MTSLPTCPTCSGLIPHAILAAPFCPWCGKPRTPGASDDDHAKRVKVAKAARSGGKTKSESVLSEGHRHSHLAFDPQIGFAMIGAHKHDDAMHLRAYDLYNKRVAWEALSGEMARDTMERVAVRGHTVYANIGRTLRALDLFTGRQKWGSEFSDVLDSESAVPHRELKIVDTTPPGHPGAVIAFTIDKTIVSMDRDTGRPLWKEKREHMPRSVQPLEQSGLVLFQIHSHLHEVINPAQQALVLRVEKSIENAWLAGRFGLWKVRNWGWRDREGLVMFDYLANQEVMFDAIDKIEEDVPFVMGFNCVFGATHSGDKLFASPNAKPTVLREGLRINQLAVAGPTLFALLIKSEGTRVRRVVGLDPQTLAVRFDLGELSTEPTSSRANQILALPDMAVIVTSSGDSSQCELWGVLPTGQIAWRTPVGSWSAHYLLGGHIVCYADGWKILRPNDGQIVMEYTRDR